jgi:hypothetical protein
MSDPLEIEQQYQHLLAILSHPAAPWHRLYHLVRFLEPLTGNVPSHESYILDCIEHLGPLTGAINAIGRSPDDLRHPLEVVSKIQDTLPALKNDERLLKAADHLRATLRGSLAFVGDVHGLLASLDHRYQDAPPEWLALEEMDDPGGRLVRLRNAAEHLSRNDPVSAGLLCDLVQQWTERLTGDAASVLVPVVEHGISGDPLDVQATLRKVTVKITGATDSSSDQLEAAVLVQGAETPRRMLVETPLKAASHLLHLTGVRARKHGLAGVIVFDQKQFLHEGDSAGAAIAALWYAAALRALHHRVSYHFRPDVVITGTVDREGGFHGVDPVNLPLKVRAAFFSHVETLVVPREQYDVARCEVNTLHQCYPHRSLDLIGVASLREVFYDLRIIHQDVAPRTAQLLRGALLH